LIATGRREEGLTLMKKSLTIDDRMIGQVFSISSDDQRLAYLTTMRNNMDAFLSLVSRHFSQSPDAVRDALSLVLRRKAITTEALAMQRDAILGGKYPHLRGRFDQLSALRMEIARKTLEGPGPEGPEVYRRTLQEWNAERERLETELAREIPEMRLEERIRSADRKVIAHSLPPDTALVDFCRFTVFDFSAVPAKGESPWKPARYCAFVVKAGDPENVALIDLGEAEMIDRFIGNYRSRLIGEGRMVGETGAPDAPGSLKPGFLSRLFGKKHAAPDPRENGQIPRDIADRPPENEAEDFRGEGLILYGALFAPLQTALGKCTRLIISPDSQVTLIPFEVIPVPEGGYLIDRYRISYAGSGRDVLRFSAEVSGTPRDPLVVASPDYDYSSGRAGRRPSAPGIPGRRSRDLSRANLYFTPLPGTKVEGKSIADLLKVRPLLEGEALESRVKENPSPRVLHIATHGFFLGDQEYSGIERSMGLERGLQRFFGRGIENPMLRSGLALAGVNTWLKEGVLPPEAEDGILTAEDVTGLDLTGTDLAVLSACDTGVGQVKVGEGVFGLRRSFIIAGARTLVMSLWKVPDIATQELMVSFYRKVLLGMPKADALREAQLELRSKYPHPRDWGAFVCQGDPGKLGG
jgi:CHAT domain-containing protein